MQCGEFRESLLDYVQGDCGPDEARSIADHASGCRPCADALEAYRVIVAALRSSALPSMEFQESLRAMFRAEVRSDIQRRRARLGRWAAFAQVCRPYFGLAAAILLAVTVSLTIVVRRPVAVPGTEIAQESSLTRTIAEAPRAASSDIDMGGAYGALIGATQSRAVGFGPTGPDEPSTVFVVVGRPYSPEGESAFQDLVRQAGGTRKPDQAGADGTVSVRAAIPADVVGHFLAGLEVLEPREISRPLEITSEVVSIVVTFNTD